ncbi:hypothetical protein H5410_056103 [Solanum commersonii]|uniref:Uncharacterized protein n=1 Tax=Solanum commersonii TaxID=4109 RepID=A0A9J5WJC8_SOLCO|nr:hypothetical protein H5410_056103 [Solanum commersonii]
MSVTTSLMASVGADRQIGAFYSSDEPHCKKKIDFIDFFTTLLMSSVGLERQTNAFSSSNELQSKKN